MKTGIVFKWKNYPKPRDGIIKDRWFIYLGASSILSEISNVFIFTTTGKTKYYTPGNKRRKNKNIVNFKAGEFGFETDCVLDTFYFQNNWTLEEFERYKDDFEIKERISDEKLKVVYEKILKENSIQTIIKKDIRRNLNKIDIYNLKIPKN
jgi:hypothetical protein